MKITFQGFTDLWNIWRGFVTYGGECHEWFYKFVLSESLLGSDEMTSYERRRRLSEKKRKKEEEGKGKKNEEGENGR